jgi:very-short-patch-repair endonuclease
VELDGFEHHSDRAHYRNDRRRGNALTGLGLHLVRFTYEDVMHRPNWVVACVLQALDAALPGARRDSPRRFPRARGTAVNP